MYKFNYALFISLLLSFISFSQDYTPFDFENAIWDEEYRDGSGTQGGSLNSISRYQTYSIGDSTANGITYYFLQSTGKSCGLCTVSTPESQYTFFENSAGIIYEEDKRIYRNSILFYDFNASLGDTIDHWYNIPDGTIIEHVDSIEWCGKMRRRLRPSNFTVTPLHFIEGIGSTHGLSSDYYYFESGAELVCYSDTGCEDQCDIISSIGNPVSSYSFDIYPNPVQNTLYIETALNPENLSIYDITGKLIHQTNFKNELSVAFLNDGMYFIQLEINGELVNRKFVKRE